MAILDRLLFWRKPRVSRKITPSNVGSDMVKTGWSAIKFIQAGWVVQSPRIVHPDNVTEGRVIHITKDEAIELSSCLEGILRRRLVV